MASTPLVFGCARPQRATVPEARRSCADWLVANDVGPDAADSVQLVVSELVTNVLTHTRSSLQLVVRAVADELTVEVYDESSIVPTIVDASADAISGRGLAIVDAVSERWGWSLETLDNGTTTGKVVWAVVAA